MCTDLDLDLSHMSVDGVDLSHLKVGVQMAPDHGGDDQCMRMDTDLDLNVYGSGSRSESHECGTCGCLTFGGMTSGGPGSLGG